MVCIRNALLTLIDSFRRLIDRRYRCYVKCFDECYDRECDNISEESDIGKWYARYVKCVNKCESLCIDKCYSGA